MIEFLNGYIDKDVLDNLKTNYSSVLFDLNCNQDECIKVIDFLERIGIKNVSELLLYRTDLFCKTLSDVEEMFLSKNTFDLVSKINDNIFEIDILFE